MSTAPQAVLDEILGSFTSVTRRVDIYEEDAETAYLTGAPLELGATITCDAGREERRTFDLSLNVDEEPELLAFRPEAFWYDKVLKAYKGVRYGDLVWEEQVGEFVIDTISDQMFPSSVAVTCRDYTKKLIRSKFAQPTLFPAGSSVEGTIDDIATNGGIVKRSIPSTGRTTGTDFLFEADTTRWAAIQEIAVAYGYEVFFRADGYLAMQPFVTPTSSPVFWTYETGVAGTVVEATRKVGDDRLYNHIAVTGEGNGEVPVYAEARNTDPSSSTSVGEIGERTYRYTSAFITTYQQALGVANNLLALHALNAFETTLSALWIPGIEAGTTVAWLSEDAAEGDSPHHFLHDFTLSMDPGPMDLNINRIELVS